MIIEYRSARQGEFFAPLGMCVTFARLKDQTRWVPFTEEEWDQLQDLLGDLGFTLETSNDVGVLPTEETARIWFPRSEGE